jgi:O-antigen ligase
MLSAIREGDPRARMNLTFLGIFLVVDLMFGGASRADALSQPVVRLAAVALLGIALIQLTAEGWRLIRLPTLLLLAVAAVMLLQLIPLPPSLWAQLPGRTLYLEALNVANIAPVWRPISLTPDLTLNSLLAVLPPLAALLALGTIDQSLHRLLIPLLLVAIVVSSLIGLLQISGGIPYFYGITNEGSAVGIFANRNHQAAFVALGFPLLACWAALPHPDPGYRRLRSWLALCMAVSIFPVLLVTGSRAGLGLGAMGILIALVLPLGRRRPQPAGRPGYERMIQIGVLILGLAVVAAFWIFARDAAFERLLKGEDNELRVDLLPTFGRIIRDYFPFGSGFGSMDTVFRSYEPDAALQATYLNHAHNELAELLMEGGLLAAAVLAAFAAWLVRQLLRLWTRAPERTGDLVGRTGTAVAMMLLAASIVDYPLRTPFLATVMALACVWMARPPRSPIGSKGVE